jgi:hypothetical protein
MLPRLPRLSRFTRVKTGIAVSLAAALACAGCAAQSTASSSPTTPAATASTSSANAQRAAAYLVSSLAGGDHVVGKFGPDLGQTSDVALGLAATTGQAAALAKVLGYLDTHAAAYVHGDPSTGEKAGAHYAGPTGKLALVAQAAGKNPSSFGGLDLTKELRALMAGNGRFQDDSKFGDFSNPLGQAFDILALQRASSQGAPKAAIDYLLTAQCKDGGFADAYPKAGAPCASTPDATGLALQALVASGAGCPATAARSWLTAHQGADGSFASSVSSPAKPAASNVNSTAYAGLGLMSSGANAAKVSQALDYLTSVQNADGGLAIVPGSANKKSDVLATAQALNALARSSFLTTGTSPIAPKALVCSPTPTAT